MCFAQHEFMASAGFDVSWGRTGTGPQYSPFNTYAPVLDVGKGFGDLPTSLNILRPLAITAEIGDAIPGQSWTAGSQNPTTLNWGFTIQYSLPYYNSHIGQIDNDFVHDLVPVTEFAFSTPVANVAPGTQITTGTIQPGVIYEADTWHSRSRRWCRSTARAAATSARSPSCTSSSTTSSPTPLANRCSREARHAQDRATNRPRPRFRLRRDGGLRPRPTRQGDARRRRDCRVGERDPLDVQRRRRAEILQDRADRRRRRGDRAWRGENRIRRRDGLRHADRQTAAARRLHRALERGFGRHPSYPRRLFSSP